MGNIHPKEFISKVSMFVVFSKQLYVLMYCMYFMLTNYTYKYYDIYTYDHDMYVITYVNMLKIYISQVNTMRTCNRYIYKIQY